MAARRIRPALVSGLIALIIVALLWGVGLLTWPELVSLDLRYQVRGAEKLSSSIVIVPISHRMFDLNSAFGSVNTWPLSRDLYTHALTNLRLAGARAVGIDILLENGAPGDAALLAEIEQWHGRVVLGFQRAAGTGVNYSGEGVTINIQQTSPLRAAQLAFRLPGGGYLTPNWPRGAGYVGVTPASDGVVHTLIPAQQVAGVTVDSFPLAIVQTIDPVAAQRYIPDHQLTIDYAGPPGAYSSKQPLDLDLVAAGMFDPGAVANKVVLIGATAPELKDLFPGPYDHGAALTSGVEINANAIQTLLARRPLQPVSYPVNAAALLGLGLLVLAINVRGRPALAAGSTLGLMGLYAGASQLLFTAHSWLDMAGPLLGSGAVYVATHAARVAESLREIRRVESIFGRYVSPQVVRQLLGKTDALRLGGQRRQISVLFSDIRGFTTLSEQLPPEEVGTVLNEFFTAMVAIIFEHGGTVDKFVGDAIMAVFNAPLDQPDHVRRAVATALAMQDAAATLRQSWQHLNRPLLYMGIGVHTGMAVVGSFGSERRSEYTAIGDTVNVAARLESLCKDMSCSIIISAAIASALDPNISASFQPLGTVPIKGRVEPLDLLGIARQV